MAAGRRSPFAAGPQSRHTPLSLPLPWLSRPGPQSGDTPLYWAREAGADEECRQLLVDAGGVESAPGDDDVRTFGRFDSLASLDTWKQR